MATTTNYSWTTPDDTALVKDGASAIRTLGTAIDTTTKNLNPSTTLGDIQYRSSSANTNTRLGIGSSGQVLTVSGGVPAWATPSAGGMTLLSTTTLSGSSTAITSIDQTYKSLYVVFKDITTSADATLRLRLNADTGSNHYFQMFGINGTTAAQLNNANLSYFEIGKTTSATNYYYATAFGTLQINRYSQTETHGFFAQTYSGVSGSGVTYTGANQYNSTTAISSLTFLPSTGTFSAGTVYVYGVN